MYRYLLYIVHTLYIVYTYIKNICIIINEGLIFGIFGFFDQKYKLKPKFCPNYFKMDFLTNYPNKHDTWYYQLINRFNSESLFVYQFNTPIPNNDLFDTKCTTEQFSFLLCYNIKICFLNLLLNVYFFTKKENFTDHVVSFSL